MGKFQSKLASKRRQSPEGGSLTSSVLSCQRELKNFHIHKTKLTENLFVELRENTSDCNGNVKDFLPTKQTPERGSSLRFKLNKQTKRSRHAAVTECNVVFDKDTQQEWVFTLYNFTNSGKAPKVDMCRLIHSIYEVLEASVKQPSGGNTPLRIKLVVTPSDDPQNTLQTAEKEQSAFQEAGRAERRLYCVDENIERRNHYLDLAGIENFSSKFDNTDSPSQEPRQEAHSSLQHHPVVTRENCISPESPRRLCPLKNKVMTVSKDRNRGEEKPCLLNDQHPASWCHTSQSLPAAQRTHSRRLRSRAQHAASHHRPTAGGDRETLSPLQPSCSRHHHHHEHHHHHHHHYHPS